METAAASAAPEPPSGEPMFSQAIALTLQALPGERAELFERLTAEIAEITTALDAPWKPWTRTVHTGTDGSRIFRGGVGFSVVIDPQGRLWRGANHEDFETTFTITPTSCEIESLTPKYSQMREYLPGARTGCGEAETARWELPEEGTPRR
jgi:hypothetical protein